MLKWLLLAGAGYLGYKTLTGRAAAATAQDAAATDVGVFVQEAARRLDPAQTWTIYTKTSQVADSTGRLVSVMDYVNITGVVGGVTTMTQTFASLPAAWAWLKAIPAKSTVANVTMAAL